MLTDEQLAAVVDIGHEQRAIEFKAAGGRSDRRFLAVVARAGLALANQRDGGHIIIGLSEDGIDSTRSGLSAAQLEEWLSFDDVSQQINAYADPPLRIQLQQSALRNGRHVVQVEVAEFDEVPVLCKKDYEGVLAAGQLYTRSMAKPESSARNTQNELREIMTLATEKQLGRFLETARSAGVNLRSVSVTRSDAELFREQAQSVVGNSDLEFSLGEPSMLSTIRPSTFEPARVPFRDLETVVRESIVRWRGWSIPFVERPRNGENWIGEVATFSTRKEVWQFFESGLFVEYQRIDEWRPDWGPSSDSDIAGWIPVWLPLLHFTEVLEIAARLQKRLWPSEAVIVELSLHGISGYALTTGNPSRAPMFSTYQYSSDSWKTELIVSPEEALTGTRHLAIAAATDLFLRFGWRGVSDEILQSTQEEALGPER